MRKVRASQRRRRRRRRRSGRRSLWSDSPYMADHRRVEEQRPVKIRLMEKVSRVRYCRADMWKSHAGTGDYKLLLLKLLLPLAPTDMHTDRQTDRQAGRQADRQTDRQTDRERSTRICLHTSCTRLQTSSFMSGILTFNLFVWSLMCSE